MTQEGASARGPLDLHQHFWTRPLLDRLAIRERQPLIARAGSAMVLHCAGESPYPIDVAAETPERRLALLDADGVRTAVIALSSPIGIEALPRAESLELIDAHLDGVAALGARFAAWGPLALDGADPADVDRLLARGCVGISVPAGALIGPERLTPLGPVLERVAARGVPLFVHPGRAPGDPVPAGVLGGLSWWPALTDYVAQMQAAWMSFTTAGRHAHPELTVVFAMLAGMAPLQFERLHTRGAPAVELRDPGLFYDTSSYGRAAIDAVAGLVGDCQLVLGSDRPVVVPLRSGREPELGANAAQLLARPPRGASRRRV